MIKNVFFVLIVLIISEKSIKIPEISHNKGSFWRQFFQISPMGQIIYFSNFQMQTIFFIDYTPWENNGLPSAPAVILLCFKDRSPVLFYSLVIFIILLHLA